MKEAAVEPAAKGKGTSKSEGASEGKKKFEVKKVRFQYPSVSSIITFGRQPDLYV